MWKYRLCAGDTQVCNAPCRVKKVVLYYNNASATSAIIYNEKAGGTTKKVWTLATLGTGSTYRISDEIDFGDEGIDLYEGCYIKWTAGEVLVVYKN